MGAVGCAATKQKSNSYLQASSSHIVSQSYQQTHVPTQTQQPYLNQFAPPTYQQAQLLPAQNQSQQNQNPQLPNNNCVLRSQINNQQQQSLYNTNNQQQTQQINPQASPINQFAQQTQQQGQLPPAQYQSQQNQIQLPNNTCVIRSQINNQQQQPLYNTTNQQNTQFINPQASPYNINAQQNPNYLINPYNQNTLNQNYGNQNNQSYPQTQQRYPLVNQRQSIDVDLSQSNDFVIEQLQNSIQKQELQFSQNINVSINRKIVTIDGPSNEIQQTSADIQSKLLYLTTQYVKQDVNLNQQEIDVFAQLTQEKQLIETNQDCKITINQSNNQQSQQQVVFQLISQNKTFKILEGDVQNVQSEAIVNSSNQQLESHMQAGVAKKIFQLGGTPYEQACKKYIQSNYKLAFGTVLHHFHNTAKIQHILTVATPQYSQGSSANSLIQIIKQNIQAIFQMADQKQIKEITLPIMGGGITGFSFDQAAQAVIATVLEVLYQSKTTVIAVNIIEIDQQKIVKAIEVTNQLIQQLPKRQVKYQWQWFDTVFKDYDDADINEQIDIGYEQFKLNNTKNEIRLIFPHSKTPGTHKVDLTAMTLTDKGLNKIQKIQLSTNQGKPTYFFNKQPAHDSLNDFLIQKAKSGISQFDIFYKQHKIVFNNQQIEQINEDTGYSRQVQKIPYQQKQEQVQNIMRGNPYQIQQFQLKQQNSIAKPQDSVSLEIISINRFQQVSIIIKNLIRNHFKEVKFLIPIIASNDLIILQQLIQDESLEFKGQINNNTIVTALVTNQGEKNIYYHIQQSLDRYKPSPPYQQQLSQPQIGISSKYPQLWRPQQQNSEKVDIPKTDQEFLQVQQFFSQTNPSGTIHKIYRIQNKNLWDIYMSEKQRIIKLHKDDNTVLTPIEQERYLWHGVKDQHPMIIYQSKNEGFNYEYSVKVIYNQNCGLWGNGIYFAEKACYSHDYSYELKAYDEPTYAGKRVLLCCIITTGNFNIIVGKVLTCNPNQNLILPPLGFDCIGGTTNNSDIFVLYSTDVRRAYPAYEVIYE